MNDAYNPVWLFDLDNTLHDARHAAFAYIDAAMGAYIEHHLHVDTRQAHYLRQHYWQRYGATVSGLVRHHGIDGTHFLQQTHLLPGLEARLVVDTTQLKTIEHLPGRKWVYTNGPHAYAQRILKAAGIADQFAGIWAMEESLRQGQYHPKPSQDALRCLLMALSAQPEQCILVDDSACNLHSAKNLGLKTVWMQGYHDMSQPIALQQQAVGVDATIRQLDELLRVVSMLGLTCK